MALIIRSVTDFRNLEWWDKGSGGSHDGSFWAPVLPPGYFALGSMGTRGYGNRIISGHSFFAVRAGADPNALAHPVDYRCIWVDKGSGADLDGSIWHPIAPTGYVALGCVANRGYGKPSVKEVVCVKKNYTVPGKAGELVWNDTSTGSRTDFGAWLVADVEDSERGVPPGTFYGVTSHNAPQDSNVMFCLKFASITGAEVPTFSDIHTMIRRYGPIYRLHPEERYLPTSVEWFVPRCTLVNKTTGEKKSEITAEMLPAGDNHQLEINDMHTYRGDFSEAKAYVHVKLIDPATTDVQFWFFYAYNGAGTARVKTLTFGGQTLSSGNASMKPLGQHEGDWEHVTIRFNNATHVPEEIYMSQHSGGVWIRWADIEKWGEHAVVYSSLNGHASYPHAGQNYSEHRKYPDSNWVPLALEFFLVNQTKTGHVSLDASRKYEIVDADFLGSGAPKKPSWLAFTGRYGRSETAHLSSQAVRDILKAVLGPFLSVAANLTIIGQLAEALAPMFKKEDQDGPTAPAAKGSWSGEE